MDRYYFWYVNKRKVWLLGILLIILAFVISLNLTDKNMIGLREQPKALMITRTMPTTTATIGRVTTTRYRIPTTTDPRVHGAARKFDTELFCNSQEDCSGNEHPLCNGFWTCEENACKWYCWT